MSPLRPTDRVRSGASRRLTASVWLLAAPLLAPHSTAAVHPVHAAPGAVTGADVRSLADEEGFVWDRRAVEHLWNRAGFGVAAADVDRWVEAGPEALVEHLLAPRPLEGQVTAPRFEFREVDVGTEAYREMSRDRQRAFRKERNRSYRQQFDAFRRDWLGRMVEGEDPLRDRMTLFWHGVFTSSIDTVKHTGAIVAQHDTLRAGALGSYDALLRAMLRDPAMLVYLDNDENRKGKPNENLAREVMELFSLGEGNYTEADVTEAARALTGAGATKASYGRAYRFRPKRHDAGEKEILGNVGPHGPGDLATILLEQPQCARYIAGRIIEYLEGVPADDARVEEYATRLRETGYDVGFLLKRLLLDPDFYRDEVVGARVASPVDYVVGTTRRLGADVPPEFIAQAAASLGQDLFRPPNVKGWDEGLAWINTSTFMMRGNVAGVLLGVVDAESVRAEAIDLVEEMADSGEMEGRSGAEMKAMGREQLRRDEVARLAKLLQRVEYENEAYLTHLLVRTRARDDASAVAVLSSALLAIEPPDETLAMLEQRLAQLRDDFDIEENGLARSRRKSERVLRQLAHLILSLPEAQLH
ncbi:MAG: DUF1800 domain-containing protein [Planctomycetota bacterium]